MENNSEKDESKEVTIARERLLQAIKLQRVTVEQLVQSAYINGILTSARVNALVELYIHASDVTGEPEQAFDDAFVKALDAISTLFETTNAKVQVANSVPKIIRTN